MPRKSYETLDRLLELALFICNTPTGVTFNDITEEFRMVSKRTLQRDLVRLQRVLPITKVKESDGLWYWKNTGIRTKISVPELFFTQDELVALKIAQALISSQFEGTSIKKSIDSLFNKIDRTLSPKQRNILEQLGECYSVLPYGVKDYSAVTSFIPDIIDSIAWFKSMKISYLPVNEEREQEYIFDPYGLVNAKGGLYLVGFVHEYKEIRTLAVERIKAVKIIGAKHSYDIPSKFSLKKYFDGAFGVIASRPEDITIRFDKALWEYLSQRKWPGIKEVKKRKDHVEMKLNVGITRELISWILSFGPHAEVIEPEPLKNRVKQDLENTLKKYT